MTMNNKKFWFITGFVVVIGVVMLFVNEYRKPTTGSSDKSKKTDTRASSSVNPITHSVNSSDTTSLTALLFPVFERVGTTLHNSSGTIDYSLIADFDTIVREISVKLATAQTFADTVDLFRQSVFVNNRIVFDPNQNDFYSIFPQTVLSRKKGSCLGTSLVYLLVAEKLKIPMYGVLVPKHFFVRFDNGVQRINVETMKGGANLPDTWYRQKFMFADSSAYDLGNLSNSQVCAVVQFTLGNVLSSLGKYTEAIELYRECVVVLPGFANAYGNMGVAFAAAGDRQNAKIAFEEASSLNGTSALLFYNMGTLLLGEKKYEAAIVEYGDGLKFHPDDPELLYGLGYAYFSIHKYSDAKKYLQDAKYQRPEFPRADSVLAMINSKGK